MLKPANNDRNIKDAMERFNTCPEDFGPSKLQVIYPNVGAGADEAAFKVLRDEMRKTSAETEKRHAEQIIVIRKELSEVRTELEKERASNKKVQSGGRR